jgi:hypothetical protein
LLVLEHDDSIKALGGLLADFIWVLTLMRLNHYGPEHDIPVAMQMHIEKRGCVQHLHVL